MSFEIVIPSARRAVSLCAKTLPLLQRLGVEAEQITLVVPSEAEAATYAEAGTDGRVGRTVVVPHDPEHATLEDIGVRPHTLGVARNAIVEMFPAGTRILQMDDDLTAFEMWRSPTELAPVERLAPVAEAAFDLADDANVSLWGVYAVRNPYFMKDRAQVGLSYIVGCMYGITIRGGEHERVVLDDKEDFERSIRYAEAQGGVLRFDNLTVATTYYKGDGGLQASRTAARVDAGARWLVREFPDFCALNVSKKSEWAEVKLRASPAAKASLRRVNVPWRW